MFSSVAAQARSEAAEQKYDWGAGVRGYEAADYLCEASACEGQELGGLAFPVLAPLNQVSQVQPRGPSMFR